MKGALLLRAVPFLALLVFIPLVIGRLSADVPAPPDDSAVSQQLMRDNLANGRLLQALYQAESLAAQTGWTLELANAAGQAWEQMGDLSNAAAFWEIASRLQPGDTSIARHLADVYLDLQRWPEAIGALQQVLERVPNDNRAHYDLGLLEAVFDPISASEHLRLAARDVLYRDISFEVMSILGDGTVDVPTVMQVGLVFAGHDLWQYAELAFGQAALLGNPFPEALAYLGLARDRQGKDGSDAVEQAIAFAPDNAQVLFLRGLHLRTIYDYDASLDTFVEAMTADPTNPAYAAELSTAYRLVGNLQDAEAWLKTAVTLSNNDPRFEDLLSAFYTTLGSN